MASSLDLLQFQPIRFGFLAETCANNDNREYCNLVQDGDQINVQLKRILGSSLGCSLLDVSATEEMTNPTFTGSAAGWTLTGGWAYGANAVSIAAGTGSVSQSMAGMVDKAVYKVIIITTVQTTGDSIAVELSGVRIGTIPEDSVAGTYTFYGVADIGTQTVLIASVGGGLTTTVTSISAFRAAPCFTFDVTDGDFSYNEITGISVNGTVNIAVTLPFEPSATYSPKATLSINGYQTGTVEFGYDGSVSGALDASNGDMIYTMNGAAYDDLGISISNFTGNISQMSFQQLSSDYYFALYDLDGNYIQSLNSLLQYCEEHINLQIDPQADGISYGCYQIGIYDPYQHTDQFEESYDFTTLGAAWATSSGTVWALTPTVGEEFTPGSANGSLSTSEASSETIFAWTKLQFRTGAITGGAAATMGVLISDAASSPIAGLSQTTPVSDTLYNDATEMDASVSWSAGSVKPALSLVGGVGGDNFIWESAYYKIYPYHLDYLSNCFTYQESIPCSKIVQYAPGANLGFNDCDIFNMRFRNLRITPSYNIKASDFIGSDGTRVLISGTMQKVYVLLFDYMGELAHDVVAAMLMSKVVYIGTDLATLPTDGIRYFLIPQDYQPEWDKDGKLNLAMGRIQMIEYNQVKFTTNCE